MYTHHSKASLHQKYKTSPTDLTFLFASQSILNHPPFPPNIMRPLSTRIQQRPPAARSSPASRWEEKLHHPPLDEHRWSLGVLPTPMTAD